MKKQQNIQDNIETLIAEYETIPERPTLRVRQPRGKLKGGLPISELERISACRHWGVVGLLPPRGPDDFEPQLPGSAADAFGG